MQDVRTTIAALLDDLADGNVVRLGEFGDNATSRLADDQAVLLRDLADGLRDGSFAPAA
jgi:hypothetical protein